MTFLMTPKEIHQVYLDTCKLLKPENYNERAQKPWEELTEEQRCIYASLAFEMNRRVEEIRVRLIESLKQEFCPVLNDPRGQDFTRQMHYNSSAIDRIVNETLRVKP